jgi:hypothetical protein
MSIFSRLFFILSSSSLALTFSYSTFFNSESNSAFYLLLAFLNHLSLYLIYSSVLE